ncbi:hypothetical protein A9X77_08375 [Brachyspira hyodysenteriae]|uniref:hypothetical protein n=1 Tax=Brachyspira hyodysenteriae TaxID=159 RepID=UPI00063D937D|nr:hypothetical protein [Brachyspira hyodysenteriae]KLI27638.1 hypothetical protein SR30_01380 [Brachyspira hyodysenteriae]TVL76930.1 hypothetical protein A9X77_08375 [Brachyspira hyodysenteriae]TVL87464.1 hypothetical protein A9X78_10390 [Brachyspira hyodysenteriae]
MDKNTIIISLISGLSGAIVSSIIYIVLYYINNKNEKIRELNNELHNILEISVRYPYLENKDFIKEWYNNNGSNNNDERYMRYEVYYNLVFNFLENTFSFYKYKEKEISNFINYKEWVRLHKEGWINEKDKYNNLDTYSEGTKKIIKDILGE